METVVQFHSADGIPLSGTFYFKDGPASRIPGIVVAHGFAGARYPKMASHFAELGYGVLTFDFRGYGMSGGERGRVIPHEQVIDLRSAITWLSCRPEIDSSQIGVVGSSLGGTVAIMAVAEDDRVKACVVGCPLGKGDSIFRMRHRTEEKYEAFLSSVAKSKRDNQRLARWDIVYIPEDLRGNLPAGIPMEFSPDTVNGFLAITAIESVSRIAPRPLLIMHAKDDRVVPFDDSRALAARAGKNCELHLIETGDHYIFRSELVVKQIGDWLMRHVPINATGPSGSTASIPMVSK